MVGRHWSRVVAGPARKLDCWSLNAALAVPKACGIQQQTLATQSEFNYVTQTIKKLSHISCSRLSSRSIAVCAKVETHHRMNLLKFHFLLVESYS